MLNHKKTINMKKIHLVAISFAFVAAVAGIFIACTKEAEPATPLMSKSIAADEAQLDEMFRSFWAHCDYAYEEKHEAFFEVCRDEDMGEFLDVTGLQESDIEKMTSLAITIIEKKQSEDPEYLKDVEVCETCGKASLQDIYYNIAEINTLRKDILDMDPSYADSVVVALPPFRDECDRNCRNISYLDASYFKCYILCLLRAEAEKIRNIDDNLHGLQSGVKDDYKP